MGDCDFFHSDPEFSSAAMNHQYAQGGGRMAKLGDSWMSDTTPSGAENETAPQIAPFYWGIKDVQYEQRPGWKVSMLKRVAENFKVPPFMDPRPTASSFSRTPEFWFGTGRAGAKAHMDSHVQATISVQLAGVKRWRLMPLRKRGAPFLGMLYSDGQPYTNDEGWKPLFDITLNPGEALFFPPGIIHETMNVGEKCSSSVTFQFDAPFAARFYRRFFPRVRQTADIHESWVIIRRWARLNLAGDEKGNGSPYKEAKESKAIEDHFRKLDLNVDGALSLQELKATMRNDAVNALGWHDENLDGSISLDEFREGFAFWSDVTHRAVQSTPKKWRKYQLHGTIDNLEDLPRKVASSSLKASLKQERLSLSRSAQAEL